MKQHYRSLAIIVLFAAGAPYVDALESETRAKMDAVFADLDGASSPGCALGVIHDGQLIYANGYGMASLEHGLPIDENTVFYVGSVSKQFVAAAVAMAAREEHLSLEDDVGKWFPELPDYAKTISVKHLIHHTSGLRDYLGLMALAGIPFENVVSADWVLRLIARQKALNFPPGEEYLYSNSGYFLLAQLVKRATGRSLRDYGEEKFFGPLGMRNTHFHDNRKEVVPHRALAYSPEGDDFVVNWSPAFDQVGSGGLLTTVTDLLEWDRSYYDGRLGEGFWDELQVHGRLNDGEALDYAFGLTIDDYHGRRRVQHGGSMFGYRAQLSRFPDEKLTVAVLCNLASANPGARASQVVDVILDDHGGPTDEQTSATPEAVALSPAERERVTGDYEISPGLWLSLVEKDGTLHAEVISGESYQLVPLSASTFHVVDASAPITAPEIRFTDTETGPALSLEIHGDGVVAERLSPREDDPEALDAWVGRFWSEELAATVRIERDGVETTYQVGFLDPRPLLLRSDVSATVLGFRANGKRDANGVVESFVIDAGRVRGIEFTRVD